MQNVGKVDFAAAPDLSDLLSGASTSDIVAVGIQEAGSNESAVQLQSAVLSQLGPNFMHGGVSTMAALQLHVFALRDCPVADVQIGVLNTARGSNSLSGSKGATALSLHVNGTSISFVNCHWSARPERVLDRNIDAHMVLTDLELGEQRVGDFDHCFLFGDLNYRVELDFEVASTAIHKARLQASSPSRHLADLLAADQLLREMRAQHVLQGFSEAPITFEPTYKWQPNSYPREIANKRGQAPSYCDRVLYRSQPGFRLEQIEYCTSDRLVLSDHIPVRARFEIKT